MENEINKDFRKTKTLTHSKKNATKNVANCRGGEQQDSKTKVEKKYSEPWLHTDGTEKSVDELKECVKSWGGREWNEYAAYLREKENRMTESLVPTMEFDKVTHEDYQKILADLFGSDEYDDLKDEARRLVMSQLSKRQKTVIMMRYWDNMPLEDIAAKLKISPRSVRVHLDRAEAKLKAWLTRDMT